MSRFYILILLFRDKQGGIIMNNAKSFDEKISKIVKKGMIKVGDVVLVNCTPHQLDIVQHDGSIVKIDSCGIIPRCSSSEVVDQAIGLIEVTKQTLGAVEGLPEEIPGAYFIVSRLVASAAHRDDLLVPGSLIRDDQGKVIGCKGLSRI